MEILEFQIWMILHYLKIILKLFLEISENSQSEFFTLQNFTKLYKF